MLCICCRTVSLPPPTCHSQAWFPKELDDPELALLRVAVSEAEYWDNTSNKLVQAYGYIKAAVTGQPHRGEGQDHDKIHLQHQQKL